MAQPSAQLDATRAQGAALREAKVALRRQVLARRDAMNEEAFASASAAIASSIIALPEFARASVALLTLAFRSEWSTRPVVRAALEASKRVAVPRVDPQTRMLEIHALLDPDRDVVPNTQGIPEPLPESPRVVHESVDFVLVPGVAFDLSGRRLGYGGGYYDRLLPLLPPRVPRIVGAFELQLVDQVPSAPHDLAVDVIVTESRTIDLRR